MARVVRCPPDSLSQSPITAGALEQVGGQGGRRGLVWMPGHPPSLSTGGGEVAPGRGGPLLGPSANFLVAESTPGFLEGRRACLPTDARLISGAEPGHGGPAAVCSSTLCLAPSKLAPRACCCPSPLLTPALPTRGHSGPRRAKPVPTALVLLPLTGTPRLFPRPGPV